MPGNRRSVPEKEFVDKSFAGGYGGTLPTLEHMPAICESNEPHISKASRTLVGFEAPQASWPYNIVPIDQYINSN